MDPVSSILETSHGNDLNGISADRSDDSGNISAMLSERVTFKRVVAHAITQPGAFTTTEQVMSVIHAFLATHGHIVSFAPQNTIPGMPHMAVVEFSDPKSTWNVLANYAGGVLIEVSKPFQIIHLGVNQCAIQGIQLLVSSLQETPFPFTNMAPTLPTHAAAGTLEEANRARDEQAARMALYYQGAALQPQQPFWYVPMMLPTPYGVSLACLPSKSVSSSSPSTMNTVASVAPISPQYPILGAAYRTPPSPALTSHQSASPSRALTTFNRPDYRRNTATRVAKSYHNASGHHNHVETSRIREGIDVRTTVSFYKYTSNDSNY